ncbi:MAG: hypothetical protein JW939_08180 [Candidatus Thermoplasmatota archaeon]|nr:hypothetical protein [Candidatus Thermoplasmatota archaeon]
MKLSHPVSEPRFEPYARVRDIRLVKDLTGWEPQVEPRTGLIKTNDWFRTVGMEKYPRNTSSETYEP